MEIFQKLNAFLKEVWVELKRVSWLSQKNVVKYTIIVFVITLVVAGFLGGLDYIFTTLIKNFILK